MSEHTLGKDARVRVRPAFGGGIDLHVGLIEHDVNVIMTAAQAKNVAAELVRIAEIADPMETEENHG